MAQEPPTSAPKASSYSNLYSVPNFQPPPGALGVSPCSSMISMSATSTDKAQQFGAMINEIARVRSRFENEKSHSDQFTQQMGMLAKQIESLTSQQSTMLGFHIGRIDSMLQELKNSKEALSKEEYRAKHEQEQRERHERLKREELQRRERLERERQEFMEKLQKEENERREKEEREQREKLERGRFEREERDRREKEEREQKEKVEREYRENMESLHQASMPSMNLSDIIPRPSRTVTASKRKLSLDLSASTAPSSLAPPSSALASLVALNGIGGDEPAKKRAKTADEAPAPDDFQAMFQKFMEQQNPANDGDEEMVTMTVPAAEDSSDLAPMDLGNEEKLPNDIHEQLKNQAMAMLQAQIAAGESKPIGADGIDLPPIGGEPSPTNQMTGVKPKPPSQPSALPPPPLYSPQETPTPATTTPIVKPEPTPAAPSIKSEAKSKPKPKKAKKPAKPVTPAVEDTTIADPMSVPLKNKAIHQWMMQDPDRLYTADDICKAGIRYRSRCSNPRKGIEKDKVYILQDKQVARKCLRERSGKAYWHFVQIGMENGWKCKPEE